MRAPLSHNSGFTLIELSIVLVIIGLIVGGVLVGQDLIRAAAVRATITQIEKYSTAVNTFRDKYGALPGDLNAATANEFGFAARGQYAGQGDGNGIIEGNHTGAAGGNLGLAESTGETAMFWEDLSKVGMIEGSFTTASSSIFPGATITNIDGYLPAAKLGGGNYFYVWSGGPGLIYTGNNGVNYFGLSNVTSINPTGGVHGGTTLTVRQAYAIDAKIDDGLPQSGRVMAIYLNVDLMSGVAWAAGGGNEGAFNMANGQGGQGPTAGSAATCYDNGGVNGVQQSYSLAQSNGSGPNCGLSFQFQ